MIALAVFALIALVSVALLMLAGPTDRRAY